MGFKGITNLVVAFVHLRYTGEVGNEHLQWNVTVWNTPADVLVGMDFPLFLDVPLNVHGNYCQVALAEYA